MKRNSLPIILILVHQLANSQQPASPNKKIFADVAIGNFGLGCNIRMHLPKNSKLFALYSTEPGQGGGSLVMEKSKFIREPWFFRFVCYQSNSGIVNDGWAILKNGVWKPKRDEGLKEFTDLNSFQFYAITSANSTGWAVVTDDIIGDEKSRRRTMNYCVAKGEQAICGDSEMGYLEDFKRKKKSDLTPTALRLLQSIEFLKDEPPNTARP